MIADLRSTVDEELDAIAPPSPISGPALATAGRRSVRRRRLAGALGGVAVVAALALLTPAILPGGSVEPAGDLASLPPKNTYWWDYGRPQTDERSTRLSEALWNALSAYDGFRFGLGGNTPYEDSADFPAIHHYDAQLADDPDPRRDGPGQNKVGPVVSLYRLDDVALYVSTPGNTSVMVDVRVVPAGGYLRQPPAERHFQGTPVPVDPWIEPYCNDWSQVEPDAAYSTTVDYTCLRSTLDTGEEVLTSAAATSLGAGAAWLTQTVVVYTATGDAVMLFAQGSPPGPYTDLSGYSLDLDRLTDVAAALARVV